MREIRTVPISPEFNEVDGDEARLGFNDALGGREGWELFLIVGHAVSGIAQTFFLYQSKASSMPWSIVWVGS